jgi:inner membrane protein
MSETPPSDITPANPTLGAKFKASSSKGSKLIIVCVLALLMSIPALFVFMILNERTHRAESVSREIGQLMGGPQVFLGPVLSVPYIVPAKTAVVASGARTLSPTENGTLIVFPQEAYAEVTSRSEVRSRSMFRVPVYTSDLKFAATFDLSRVLSEAKPGALLLWDKAEILTGASDSRGARKDITLQVGPQKLIMSPSLLSVTLPYSHNRNGDGGNSGGPMSLFSAPVSGLSSETPLKVEAQMRFTGAQKLGVMAYGKTTAVKLSGDWNYPSFGGDFLPANRAFHHDAGTPLLKGEVDLKSGFEATWSVPYVARGIPGIVDFNALSKLSRSELSVTFVEPTNPYQSVGRSLKYAMLFVGLVFLAYFLFESTSKQEVHPAQYVLVGLAQITFYLLLLSFAERIGFDAAFLVAASATVLLISAYAGMIFKSRLRFGAALAAFGLLYAMIYLLMRMEDYALLVGAVAAFGVIAAVMILTRNINWYGRTDTSA